MTDEVIVKQKAVVATAAELAAAREARNMSQVDISQRIKLQVRQVAALEEGRWEALPGRSFVRGALRSYGKLIDVDVAPLLETIGGHAEPSVLYAGSVAAAEGGSRPGPAFDRGGRGGTILWVIAGLIGVVALVLYFGADRDLSAQWPGFAGSSSRSAGAPAPAGSSGTASAGSTADDRAGSGAGSGTFGPIGLGGSGSGVAGSGGSATPPVSSATPAPPVTASNPIAAAPSAATSAATTSAATTPAAAGGSPAAAPAGSPAGSPPMSGATGGAPPATSAPGMTATPGATAPASVSSPPIAAAPAGGGAAPASGASSGQPGAQSSGQPGVLPASPEISPAAKATEAPGVAAAAAPAADGTGFGGAGSGGAGVVRFNAVEDSWIEVRQADGKALQQGLVKAGNSIELKGTPPYRIIAGNPGKLELYYEGQQRNLAPHTARNIARLTLQ
ncbi:MAG: helix-turn-helix domain-containing protein [Lautropia sp.]